MIIRLVFALLVFVALVGLACSDEPKAIVKDDPSALRYRSPTAFRFRSPNAPRYRSQVQRALPNPEWCLDNCAACANKFYPPGTVGWTDFYNWCWQTAYEMNQDILGNIGDIASK